METIEEFKQYIIDHDFEYSLEEFMDTYPNFKEYYWEMKCFMLENELENKKSSLEALHRKLNEYEAFLRVERSIFRSPSELLL